MKPGKIILIILTAAMAIAVFTVVRLRINEEKYIGHGFPYMHGYSSTDFTGYHVYDGEKLAVPDRPSLITIENPDDMPVLDGAEACYPLYAAAAKAVYQNIGEIEAAYRDSDPFENGKIVTFTNTVYGYERLVDRKVDIMIAARPSDSQKEYAAQKIEQIETLPIAEEAFVFFVEESNPVSGLTSEQIRAIYHGDITNWKEVGGPDLKIIAFQRPENSGSQVMMKYFMGDVSLKELESFETISPMDGIVRRVAEYHNEAGAIGYTFRYFLTGLNQEKNVRILTVDGVEPTAGNIQNGTYPAKAQVVAAKLCSNDDPYVRLMMEFLISEQGQELVEKTGYVPLRDPIYETRIENELPVTETYSTEDGRIRFVYNPSSGYYARAEIDGVMYDAYWSYYGSMMEIAEMCDRWSLAFDRNDTMNEILFKQEGDHYTVCGYMNDNSEYIENAPEGMPLVGTLLYREE